MMRSKVLPYSQLDGSWLRERVLCGWERLSSLGLREMEFFGVERDRILCG